VIDEWRPGACGEYDKALAAKIGDLLDLRGPINKHAEICFSTPNRERSDLCALLACTYDEANLYLANVGVASINKLKCIARATTVLDIHLNCFRSEPAFSLGEVHGGMNTPGQEI